MELSELKLKFTTSGEQGAINALHSVDAGIKNVESDANRGGGALRSMFNIGGGVALGGAIFSIGRGILDLGKNAISTNAQLEQSSLALETVTGSASKAASLIKDVQAFAAKTPFAFPELIQATINLESFGLKSQEWLPVIGDTAAAMGKSVDQVTQAVLDAETGQYERLKELGISSALEGDKLTFTYLKNGKTITQTVDKNNKEVIGSTLAAIWNDKYAGAMEKQSKSFSGLWSTVKDNVNIALASMTEGIFNSLRGVLSFVADVFAVGFSQAIQNAFGDSTFGQAIQNLGTLVGDIIEAFGSGSPIRTIVQDLPKSWQGVAMDLLRISDAIGDIVARFRSGGFVAGIQQIGAEIKSLAQNLGPQIVDGLKNLGQGILNAIQNTDLTGVGEMAGRLVRAVILGINNHWKEVGLALVASFLALPAMVVGIDTVLAPKALELIRGFVKGLDVNWSAVGDWFQGLPGRIADAASGLAQALVPIGGEVMANFIGAMTGSGVSQTSPVSFAATPSIVGQIVDWLKGLPGQIKSALPEFKLDFGPPQLPDWFTNFDWLNGPAQTVVNTIGAWIDVITGKLGTLFGLQGQVNQMSVSPPGSAGFTGDVPSPGLGAGGPLVPVPVLPEVPPVKLTADTSALERSLTDIGTKIDTFVNATHQASITADTGPAQVAFGAAELLGASWSASVFSATITADFSGAVSAAQSAAQAIHDLLPHSPAKTGPLRVLPRWSALYEGLIPAGRDAVGLVSNHASLIAGAFGAGGGMGMGGTVIYQLNGVNGRGALKEVQRMAAAGTGRIVTGNQRASRYAGAKLG